MILGPTSIFISHFVSDVTFKNTGLVPRYLLRYLKFNFFAHSQIRCFNF